VRRPWFKAQPVTESFFETAPVRLSESFDIARPAAAVWAELTGDDPLTWCRIIDQVTWTSPRPFGIGTTRDVHSLRGANVIRESYFRWDEGRRKSFYVIEASAPLFRRFAEDYLVEEVSEGSCRFTWTIAFEARPLTRPAGPINKMLLRTLFRDTRRHYGAG
jgi:hypothetical protein